MNYRQNPALGGSDIRAMVADYEKWLFERKLKLAGDLPPWLQSKTSPAAEFGTLVHMAILEPWLYADIVVIPYHDSYATKAGRDAKAEAEKEARARNGFTIRFEHAWAIEQIRKNLPKNLPEVRPGFTELERFGMQHGIAVKGKLDWLCEVDGLLTLIDVKTISDYHKRADALFWNNYHCQLAHYASLIESDKHFARAILWIESVAPFRSELQIIDPSVMIMAEAARQMALKRYASVEEGPFG